MQFAPAKAEGPTADTAGGVDTVVEPAPPDLLPETDDLSPGEGSEEAQDPAPHSDGHEDGLAAESIAEVHEIEPATIEDEPREESIDDPVDVEDDGSSEEPEPQPDEAEFEAGEPEAPVTEDQVADGSDETGTASIEWNNGETSPGLKTEYRLIEELEPRKSPARTIEAAGSFATLLKELDEQLAALPSGIELIDLPILERRRIADRRQELLSDRERLLEQKKRGAHRRRKRSRTKS